MIWDEEFETLPQEAMQAVQLRRLQQVVQRVYNTVPFYKRAFDHAGAKWNRAFISTTLTKIKEDRG